ncbi:MAG: rhomboid family protease GlpG [Bacteroidetes bacterium]|nr:rhomboid family protease GlpG [Bacteroidota bacterium]
MLKNIWDDIVNQFKQGSAVTRLIIAFIVVFIGFETLHLILWASHQLELYYTIYSFFALPPAFGKLLKQPWSAFTWMFMHADVGHIFFNLLSFYWFGEIYQLYMRDRRVFPLFIFGSLTGGFLFMLLSLLLPAMRGSEVPLVGASAGIFAIMFAATALNPDHGVNILFFGRVPIKYVALVAFLISFVAITHGNAGGMISHIGGALFGFLYIKSLQAGTDWFTPLDKIGGLFNRSKKLKATHVRGKSGSEEKKDLTTGEQKRLDEILDKISRSGYNSLSKEEKEFLFKYSNK